MENNNYMINLQKLLYILKELHSRGYEKLRLIPSLSPSGVAWRCSFLAQAGDLRDTVIASNWIQDNFSVQEKEIELSISELTDIFIKDHFDFIGRCTGENKTYVEWYADMLTKLGAGELPYAFAEYFSPTNYWKTSTGQQIFILHDEDKYYTDY